MARNPVVELEVKGTDAQPFLEMRRVELDEFGKASASIDISDINMGDEIKISVDFDPTEGYSFESDELDKIETPEGEPDITILGTPEVVPPDNPEGFRYFIGKWPKSDE